MRGEAAHGAQYAQERGSEQPVGDPAAGGRHMIHNFIDQASAGAEAVCILQ